MKIVVLVPLIAMAGPVECHAGEALAPQKFVGKYTFNSLSELDKQKCKLVTAAFASQLAARHFTCKSGDLTSAGPTIACGDPGPKTEYLMFDTNKACESERQDQSVAE